MDEANAKKIVDKISQIANIHAVLWVSKADENRLTPELKYCIEHFKGMMPNNYKNNVFACFTHVTSQSKVDAREIVDKLSIASSNVFSFENSCLMPSNFVKEFFAKMDDEDKEDEIASNQRLWRRNKKNFDDLITVLGKIDPCSSKPIVRLYLKRKLIEFMLLSYKRNKQKLNESEIESSQTVENLVRAIDLCHQNENYETYIEKTIKVNKPQSNWNWINRLIGLDDGQLAEDTVVEEIFDPIKYQDYVDGMIKGVELTNEWDKQIDDQQKYSSNIQTIKAPIVYIEQMIK